MDNLGPTAQTSTTSAVTPKRSNKNKALLFIFIPILLWSIPFFTAIIDINRTPSYSPSGEAVTTDIRQNMAIGLLTLLISLLSPLLLIMLIYGIVLLFRKPAPADAPQKEPRFTASIITLIIGVAIFDLGHLSIWHIRASAGYAGSMAEIGAIPFYLCGFLLSIVGLVLYFVTLSKRKSFQNKHQPQQT